MSCILGGKTIDDYVARNDFSSKRLNLLYLMVEQIFANQLL